MLLVRVRVDGCEQTPDTLRPQVKGSLAVRRGRSVSQNGDVGYVVSRPALGLLVPPDDSFRARIGLAILVARRPVIEDAHVVGPCPPEARIEAEAPGIRLRVSTLREVLAIGENARVDPRTRRRRTVRSKIANFADKITRFEASLRVVAQGVAVDLAQH